MQTVATLCLTSQVDPLAAAGLDLLDDSTYERLLCFSGQVAMGHGSPPCCEYTRLKLRPGPGPRPLRTPEEPYRVQGLSWEEETRLADSFMLVVRTIQLLLAVYESGGMASCEHPANSMVWLLRQVRHFVTAILADVIVVAACSYGLDRAKHWACASCYRPLQALASSWRIMCRLQASEKVMDPSALASLPSIHPCLHRRMPTW